MTPLQMYEQVVDSRSAELIKCLIEDDVRGASRWISQGACNFGLGKAYGICVEYKSLRCRDFIINCISNYKV